MSTTALYKALLEAKVSEEVAERAVEGLARVGETATKSDIAGLEKKMAELETPLLLWNIVLAGVIIAAVGIIVRL